MDVAFVVGFQEKESRLDAQQQYIVMWLEHALSQQSRHAIRTFNRQSFTVSVLNGAIEGGLKVNRQMRQQRA